MRLSIITGTAIISLGIFAKDIFMETVLKADENGAFDTINIFTINMTNKVEELEIDHGITKEIKEGMIKAFSKMKEGEKFLVNRAWITDIGSNEAKIYFKIVELLNNNPNDLSANEIEDEARNIILGKKANEK